MKCSLILFLPLASMLFGCSHTGSYQASSKVSEVTTIRNAQGQTQYRIQDGGVFNTSGQRVARIDNSGNVYNTSGVRIARIGKK